MKRIKIFDATPYFENQIFNERIQNERNQYEYDKAFSNIRYETDNGNLIPDNTTNDALSNNSDFSLSLAVPVYRVFRLL
ncbi:MAG: hypothetical protein GYA02_09290 [Clostridiaceae bacterium]|jgi:hypothetical protein|nr:hypothetical protein [Clostridiaceae bacterium]